jgi:sulfite reductase (NADPH) flavoprotein alpha-component
LTILYGSETGNSAGIASRLAAAAQAAGLAPTVGDLRDYRIRRLKDEKLLLIVTATHGEGDPPQAAHGFFEFIESRKAPSLPELRFAVLALGDMSYEHYCEAGRRIDARLEALGAQRLHARVDCDIDYESCADAWIGDIVALLAGPALASGPAFATERTLAHGALATAPGYGKAHPFPATVVENLVLAGRGSTRETRHIELSLDGSGLDYQPGDALGVVTSNAPADVRALLDALHLAAEAAVRVNGSVTTLREALTHTFEITTATPRFLEHWTRLAGGRSAVPSMSGAERNAFLRRHHIVDIVRSFPLADIDPGAFLVGLRPLAPRLYSIASSHAAAPGEAHLTVAPVRFALHGQQRSGVASGALADRGDVDSQWPVYIHSNPHFRLPDDHRPVIMIGAGTGVAPYRAFLQEREVRGERSPAWLIFGERNFRTDFLYQAEWQGHLKDGTLTRMDVAFSRDHAEKVYVQHRLREHEADVYAWLEDGANVYVCGDASRLAPDVHGALLAAVERQAGTTREAAAQYLSDLSRDGRYQRDVY